MSLPGNSCASDCCADIDGLSWGLPGRGDLLQQGAERHAATGTDLLERSLHAATGRGGLHEQGSFEFVLAEDTEKSRRDATYSDHRITGRRRRMSEVEWSEGDTGPSNVEIVDYH